MTYWIVEGYVVLMLNQPHVVVDKFPVLRFQLLLFDFKHFPRFHAFDVLPCHICGMFGLVHVPERLLDIDRDSGFVPSDLGGEAFVQRNTR